MRRRPPYPRRRARCWRRSSADEVPACAEIRLEDAVIAWLREEAARQHRSVSGLVTLILAEHIASGSDHPLDDIKMDIKRRINLLFDEVSRKK